MGIVLPDLSYNERGDSNNDHAEYDEFDSSDVKNVAKVL